jgi:potassium channel subfamily K
MTLWAKNSPSKRYAFDDWVWYLKLLGEGESGSSSNRGLLGMGDVGEESLVTCMTLNGSSDRQEKEERSWSWIGEQSPLMANKGEPEWILERLFTFLERELKIVKVEGLGQTNISL